MINSIIEAINVALDGEFGEDYEIYMEENQQGLRNLVFLSYARRQPAIRSPGEGISDPISFASSTFRQQAESSVNATVWLNGCGSAWSILWFMATTGRSGELR